MKQWLNGVGEWLNYVRNYKEAKSNEEITDAEKVEQNKKIKKLQKELKDREYIAKEKDNLIALKEKRIEAMGNKISGYAKRNDELRSVIETQYKENEKLQEKLKEKELARRKSAGAIGGLKAKINLLNTNIIHLCKELERANQRITWLKTNQKAPTKEEIIKSSPNIIDLIEVGDYVNGLKVDKKNKKIELLITKECSSSAISYNENNIIEPYIQDLIKDDLVEKVE